MRSALPVSPVLLAALACKPGLPSNELDAGEESSSTSESGATETDEQPACDLEALHACIDAYADELEYCMHDNCGEFEIAATCHAQFEADYATCIEAFCPGAPDAATSDCVAACDDRRTICETEESCGPNDCAYERLLCTDTCSICNEVTFEFEYSDSCELLLPGPPFGLHQPPFVSVEIAGYQWAMSEPGVECGDPVGFDVVWKLDATVLLCDLACEAFATAGAAAVVFGYPPCE